MLEQFSDQICLCYKRAAEAKERADATNDPALKAEFLNSEERWQTLASSYGSTESLEAFSAVNSERRRKFDGRLRSIFENSDDAIITENLDGIISGWNKSAERLYGYTAEEVIGKSITILIPPERHDEEPKILARIRRGEHVHHYETVRVRMVVWSIFR